MNERISAAELEVQRIRIQDMLNSANLQVWNNRRFPTAHTPDIATLKSNIFFSVDDAPEAKLEPHPLLLPEILSVSNMNLAREREEVRHVKDSWYNPVTRATIYHPRLLKGPEDDLRRSVYNSAGADISLKYTVVTPDQYSNEDREFIASALTEVFVPGANISLSQTEIHQSGYRRIMTTSGYVIGEMAPREVMLFNEMYPVAFELITDQIMRRQGDFQAFEMDAKSGRLRLKDPHLDPNASFAHVLFAALRHIDWRDILTALNMNDIENSVDHLEKSADLEDMGAGVFLELFKAVARDQDQLQQFLRFLRHRLK